jgi:uncharacterized protein YdeI (YjbR/CyaY-like superfamily)
MPELPENSFFATSRTDWRAWLQENHERSSGIWLVFYKKSAGKPTLTYDEQVEEALCFGWVDSRPGKLDDERTMLYFSPRKPKSGWARPNKERIERLLAANLMMPAGLEKIEAAKKDGSWGKLDAVENLEIPEDLSVELQKYPEALKNFEAFPRSAKRGILEWIVQAKKPETRKARIEETARLAQENRRANQWPR